MTCARGIHLAPLLLLALQGESPPPRPELPPPESPVRWELPGEGAAQVRPAPEGTAHHVVYEAEDGDARHYAPRLAWTGELWLATWSVHSDDVDAPGRHAWMASSADGARWSEPVELFPPLGETGPFGTTGFLVAPEPCVVTDGRAYALARVEHLRAYTDLGRTKEKPRGDPQRYNYEVFEPHGRLARRVVDGRAEGAPFWIADEAPEPSFGFEPLPAQTAEVVADVGALLERGQAAGLEPEEAFRARVPDSSLRLLVELTRYRRPDGARVRLFRDELFPFRLHAAVRGAADEEWGAPLSTDVPDGRGAVCAGALPDGTVYLLGNLPAGVPSGGRPVLALSDDGVVFDRAFELSSGPEPPSRPGRLRWTRGIQAGGAVERGGRLFVIHATDALRISVTVVPVAGLTRER